MPKFGSKRTFLQLERRIKNTFYVETKKQIFGSKVVGNVSKLSLPSLGGGGVIGRIRDFAIKKIEEKFEQNQTYQDLLGDSDLRGQIGLTPNDARRKVPAVKNYIKRNTGVVTFFRENKKSGELRLTLRFNVPNLEKMLAQTFATHFNTDRHGRRGPRLSVPELAGKNVPPNVFRKRNQLLPWLRWLTMEGQSVIIKGHDVLRDRGQGRSKLDYLMNSQYISGRSWKVPAQHSGTEADNFITRSLDSTTSDINREFRRLMKNAVARATRAARRR